MKSKPISFIILLLFCAGLNPEVFAQDGTELLKKMDGVIFAPKDKQAVVQIITYKNSKEEKVKEAQLLQKGIDKKIYRYTKPESDAGIATLSLPGDIMWMKMPAFDKPKKISLLAKSQAFNNTDFAWEDIPNEPYSERYDAKFIEATDTSYSVEMDPKNKKSNYSKLIVFILKSNYCPYIMDYYDNSGKMVKEETFTYQKTGKYWNASRVTMTDLKKRTSTRITMTDVKFDQDLPDKLFTEDEFWK